MTRREIEDYLIERAMIEPEFRDELLRCPDQLLRRIGLPVGKDVTICVLEEEPKSFYLILPRVLPEPGEVGDETSDPVEGGSGRNLEMFRFFQGYA